MAEVGVSSEVSGVGSNPGLYIKAPDYVSEGASVVTGSSYLDGQAVRGTYVGQEIMSTPWFSAGTFNNIVTPLIYIEGDSDVTGASADAVMYYDKIKIDIMKRYPGSSTYKTTAVYVNYVSNISNKIGIAPHQDELNRPAWLPLWFDPRYEYKFVLSIATLTIGAYLDVEAMYLQYIPTNSVISGRQIQYGNDTDLQLAQGVPITFGIYWGGTSDTSGNLELNLPSEYFPFTVDSSYSSGGVFTKTANPSVGTFVTMGDNAQKAVINSVESVQCTLTYTAAYGLTSGYAIQPWAYAWPYTDGSNGGYGIKVRVYGGTSLASTYFEGIVHVYGYMSAKAV